MKVICNIDPLQVRQFFTTYICTVKFTLVITLFVAMLVQTFSQALIMADFYWNQARIEQELCENKTRPELLCKGNCQLKKELEKENKNEIPKQLQEIKVFLNTELYTLAVPDLKTALIYVSHSNDNRIFTYSGSVFRPPSS